MLNTQTRKSQLARAKRRYEFKKMVSGKESKGIKYSITGDELAELFMNQPEELRVSGVVFLRGYRVAGDNDDTGKSIDADTKKVDGLDTVKAIDLDTIKADDTDTMQTSPTAYQGIPLETSQHELIEFLARFFHARHIAPDDIRRTINRIAEYHNITLIPETTLDALPNRIAEAVNVTTFIAEDVAKAILGGLRKAAYGDTQILTILDCIAALVRNPSKNG
jgi:hypothetical protein